MQHIVYRNSLLYLRITLVQHAGGGAGGGGGERLVKDLKRKANSLSRDTRQANALGLKGAQQASGIAAASLQQQIGPFFLDLCTVACQIASSSK